MNELDSLRQEAEALKNAIRVSQTIVSQINFFFHFPNVLLSGNAIIS